MVTYKFELINSLVPVLKGRNIVTDSNVGGIKNTYRIRIVYKMNLEFDFFSIPIVYPTYYSRLLGVKSFLKPYQSVWDKRKHRLPPTYWGKGPLLNLWLVLSNDYKDIKDIKALLPEGDTTHHCTKIFNVDFLSQTLAKNLKSSKTFYQSKFKKS